jgi:hypothetical protein
MAQMGVNGVGWEAGACAGLGCTGWGAQAGNWGWRVAPAGCRGARALLLTLLLGSPGREVAPLSGGSLQPLMVPPGGGVEPAWSDCISSLPPSSTAVSPDTASATKRAGSLMLPSRPHNVSSSECIIVCFLCLGLDYRGPGGPKR